MKTILLLIILALQLFAVYYLVRTARTLGSKSTQHHNALMANINLLKEAELKATGNSLLNHLLVPDSKEFKNMNWDYVISLTSHPARFNTLDEALKSLLEQRLIPKKIYLNIAEADIDKLPVAVKSLEAGGVLKINVCSDLGPAKKLIPTLKIEESLPIIVVDDDLIFETDLTLKLMIQHPYPLAQWLHQECTKLNLNPMASYLHIVSGEKIMHYLMVQQVTYLPLLVLAHSIKKSSSIKM